MRNKDSEGQRERERERESEKLDFQAAVQISIKSNLQSRNQLWAH